MTKQQQDSKKSSRERNTKLISTGLAVATGIGVVGLIGVRTAQDVSANATASDASTTGSTNDVATVSSAGYTQAQLDTYAVALAREAERLQTYRNQLNDLVNQLNGQTKGSPSGKKAKATQPASEPVAKPAPKPAPAIAKPQPQAKSEGS